MQFHRAHGVYREKEPYCRKKCHISCEHGKVFMDYKKKEDIKEIVKLT